jgi:hypothetical protein
MGMFWDIFWMIVMGFAGIAGIFYSAVWVTGRQVAMGGTMRINWRYFCQLIIILILSIICLACSFLQVYILGSIDGERRAGSIKMTNGKEIRRVEAYSPIGENSVNPKKPDESAK